MIKRKFPVEITSEKITERKVVEAVKKAGGLAVKLLAITGLPDRLVLLPPGRICFAEIKTTGKRASKVQLAIHRQLRAMGFRVYLINCKEGLEEFKMFEL